MSANKEITARQQEYWKKNVGLIRNLLIIWAITYLPSSIFAEFFSKIPFFGVNVAFWFAHQGSMIIYVVLIFVYAVRMGKLDEEYDVQEVKVTDQNKGVSA